MISTWEILKHVVRVQFTHPPYPPIRRKDGSYVQDLGPEPRLQDHPDTVQDGLAQPRVGDLPHGRDVGDDFPRPDVSSLRALMWISAGLTLTGTVMIIIGVFGNLGLL